MPAPYVDGFLHNGANVAVHIFEFNPKGPFDGHGIFKFCLETQQILVCKPEGGVKLRPSRRFEINPSRFVPNEAGAAKTFNEHNNVDRVNGPKHTASKDRTDVIARSPIERDANAHFAEIGCDERDPAAGTAIRRNQVVTETKSSRFEGLIH